MTNDASGDRPRAGVKTSAAGANGLSSGPFSPVPSRSGAPFPSLEIERVLADSGNLTFRSKGTCMYPTIRPGDILRLRSSRAEDIPVGAIAVYRKPPLLFSHRVVGTGEEDGCIFLITRADGGGNDDRVFDDALLGVVTAIERRGRPVPLARAHHSGLVRLWFDGRRAWIRAAAAASRRRQGLLARAQEGALYHWLVRRWLAVSRPAISFTVRLPVPGDAGTVARQMPPDAFDANMEWWGRPLATWALNLHLNGARQPVAWIRLVRDETGTWRVEQTHVRHRYRGGGLDAALRRQLDQMLARKT